MADIHTGESLNIRYYASGMYDREALDRLNHLLRCHYTNDVKTIDVKLLDLLCDISDIFGRYKQVQIISGYRSSAYNEYLRSLGRNVAKHSLHLLGLAIDFVIPGVSTYKLFNSARSFAVGGVGHYSKFVHIDTGRIRYW
ncbi:MAG TPA: hypothetical protein DEP99_02870 [Nitrospiraceae bacterium]|nr:hypothetical protein [Nitrospiraceae bacterium]